MTAAEKRAREVRERTGGRRTEGHGAPTSTPKRAKVEWVDEGEVRDTARRATKRAAGGDGAPNRIKGIPRGDRPLPSDVARDVERGVGQRQSQSTSERLQKAIDAFERERFAESSKLLVALSRQLPRMALVHELAGLSAYRQAKWRTVVNELEAVRVLDAERVSVIPVLADAYRALKRWVKVRDLWEELKKLSPHPSILAEGRIVAAGALADQSKIADALEMFDGVLNVPKRVQDYHLRQWYMAADLHDQVGNVTEARVLFARIMQYDPKFVDVDERLTQLGAPRRR
jgi:tetratricopeptide (TPR) repeat protein